jgi:hypothetical protein
MRRLALVDPNGSATDVNNVYVTNPNTTVVGLRQDNTNGSNRPNEFVYRGWFIPAMQKHHLRLQGIRKILSKISVSSFRVFANVTNAFIITNYKGTDPEIGSWDPLSGRLGWWLLSLSRGYLLLVQT